MVMDLLAVFIAATSFGLFLLIHMVACRRMSADDLLKSLWRTCALTLILPCILTILILMLKITVLPFLVWSCIAFVATALHGILCFVYVLCVFGPYETSVRMRLIREIFKAPPQGLTQSELNACYNHESIARIRLRRLTGSNYIVEKDGLYRVGGATNVFFVFDIITGVLIKMIGRK